MGFSEATGQPGRTAGPGWPNTCLQYLFVAGRVLAVHKPRDACLISLPELAARGHLNERVQSFSTAIASPLLRARPVSTVTQGRAVCYETRDRRSVQRRECSQRRGLRRLGLGSAQYGSFSARMKPDTLHRSSLTLRLRAKP